MFVITSLGWGGAQSQVMSLAIGLKNRGWDVQVVSLLTEASRRHILEVAGIPVHTLGMRAGIPDPRAILRLAVIIRKFRPSIVHSHMVHANLLTRIARITCDIPILISTAHNVTEGGGWRPLAYRLTDSLADLTTNVSMVAVEKYIADKAVPADKIRYMPNGIDITRFQRNEHVRMRIRAEMEIEDQFVWLAVGRLEPQKDYHTMIEAVAEVVSVHPKFKLLIAGDGPLRDELEGKVNQLDLTREVRFLGIRSDIPELMSAADSYLMSSAWEGLPIVLLEAAASELPIIATDVGGNSEIVHHGLTGELVPPGDASALASAMVRMMTRPEHERAQMGARGRAHVQKTFGLSSVLDRWEELYAEIWNSRFDKQTKG